MRKKIEATARAALREVAIESEKREEKNLCTHEIKSCKACESEMPVLCR